MNLKGVLEGLLFVVGDEGITLNKLLEIMDISKEELQKLILELKEEYENDNRGIRLSIMKNY